MRFAAAFAALLALCTLAFPSFTFLQMANGTGPSDTDEFFKFSQPTALYLVGDRLYVADSGRSMIYILNASANMTRTKYLTSPSLDAYLSNPMHMDYEGATGTLYVAGGTYGNILYYDGSSSRVEKWNLDFANVQKASGVAVTNDTIYLADAVRGQVIAFSRFTKKYSHIVLWPGGSDGMLSTPQDIVFHDGKYYVSDSGKGLIFVYDSNFTFLNLTIGRGKGDVALGSPRGMDFDGSRLYVADATAGRVVAFSPDGYPVDVLNASTPWGNLSYPDDVVVDNGILYVADTQNRAVKAFRVNITGGDPTVLAQISDANATCASLDAAQSVAKMLSVSYAPLEYSAQLFSAQQYYNLYQFSYASSLAQVAKADCAAAQSSLLQSIDLKVKQLIQSSQAQVAPYRNSSSTSQQLLSQFDNKVAAANSALSSKKYSSAADLALSLPSLADSIASGSQAAAEAEAEKEQNRAAALINAEITALSGRLEQLQAKSDAYRQGINLSNSRSLLALASGQAGTGSFDSANRSLQLASLEITSYETSVGGSAKEIDSALANFAIIELEFNNSASQPVLFGPDLSSERALMAQAKDTIYANPPLALQIAGQAKSSAQAKSRDAQALSLAASSVCVVVFLIALIAVGFFMHLRGRKHKGL
jgi:DNA-binding beta-propeller fold protein YncE